MRECPRLGVTGQKEIRLRVTGDECGGGEELDRGADAARRNGADVSGSKMAGGREMRDRGDVVAAVLAAGLQSTSIWRRTLARRFVRGESDVGDGVVARDEGPACFETEVALAPVASNSFLDRVLGWEWDRRSRIAGEGTGSGRGANA